MIIVKPGEPDIDQKGNTTRIWGRPLSLPEKMFSPLYLMLTPKVPKDPKNHIEFLTPAS